MKYSLPLPPSPAPLRLHNRHRHLPTTGNGLAITGSLLDDIMQFVNTCLDTVPNRSIATLARRSKVNEQTIRNVYFRGQLPSITTLALLAKACRIRLSIVATSGVSSNA